MDFKTIASHGGSQNSAFEEFVCQLARRHPNIPGGSRFQRNGVGADLGVECLWRFADGSEWGWQAKYVFDISSLKAQVDKSLAAALAGHERLTRYFVAFPFVPSASSGRGGTSQAKRLEGYKAEWRTLASSRNVHLEVEDWNASELSDRLLQIDASGGRRFYWFSSRDLTASWFAEHLRSAEAVAGPRYTPKLNVGGQMPPAFAALTRSSAWQAAVTKQRQALAILSEDWQRSMRDVQRDPSVPDIPSELNAAGAKVNEGINTLRREVEADPSAWSPEGVSARLTDLVANLQEMEESFRRSLVAKHGPKSVDSVAFRQWHAEYQATFPMAHLDRCREALKSLNALSAWINGPNFRAALQRLLMVCGPAGIGKTHSLLDECFQRQERGAYSIVTFGERFRATSVWDALRGQLGVDGALSFDAFLDGLDAAAEASGHVLLFAVDALNETPDWKFWRAELNVLRTALENRKNVALCVTCRSGFAEVIALAVPGVPIVEHPGFQGREFDAATSFFHHFGLHPPIGPLLQPEFSNPLVLKLTCKALQAKGVRELPRGWRGFADAVKARLETIGGLIAAKYGLAGKGRAHAGIAAIVDRMAALNERAISKSECLALLAVGDGIPPHEVLALLVDEEILRVSPGTGPSGMLTDPEDVLGFAYERLGDHLIVRARLESCGGDDARKTLALTFMQHRNLAEAISVQLPEILGLETLDLLGADVISDEAAGAWLTALSWRPVDTIGDGALRWLTVLLRRREVASSALEAALMLAVRQGHALRPFWLHELLTEMPMGERDSLLCPFLHEAYEARSVTTSIAVRLIESAWNPTSVRAVSDDLAELWLATLVWFFAACDRRVRDDATRSAVLLAESRPIIWINVLRLMSNVDDDYVRERGLLAAYGTLLRSPETSVLAAVREVVLGIIPASDNALLRDTCRALLDLAARSDALPAAETVDSSSWLPPYTSSWPLVLPTDEELEAAIPDGSEAEFPRIRDSVLSTYEGDFAIYTIPQALRHHSYEVSEVDARRWICKRVVDLGYSPALHAPFDRSLIAAYGSGRGRPAWAERIGKKYQWIALHKLLGIVADHVPAQATSSFESDPSPRALQAQWLRDIDPSVVTPAPDEHDDRCWSGIVYNPSASCPNDDDAWCSNHKEIKALADRLWTIALDGQDWLPLEAYPSWIDRGETEPDEGFRRQVWLHVRSYLVPQNDFQACWKSLRGKSFMGRWMPEGREITDDVFIGEYDWGAAIKVHNLAEVDWLEAGNGGPLVMPTCNSLSPSFSKDASKVGDRSMLVPVPLLMEDLRWNGYGGFIDRNGRTAICDPSFLHSGFSACMIRADYLKEFLSVQRMSLIWTVLGESLPGSYRVVNRLEFSSLRGMHNGEYTTVRAPVTRRR